MPAEPPTPHNMSFPGIFGVHSRLKGLQDCEGHDVTPRHGCTLASLRANILCLMTLLTQLAIIQKTQRNYPSPGPAGL